MKVREPGRASESRDFGCRRKGAGGEQGGDKGMLWSI